MSKLIAKLFTYIQTHSGRSISAPSVLPGKGLVKHPVDILLCYTDAIISDSKNRLICHILYRKRNTRLLSRIPVFDTVVHDLTKHKCKPFGICDNRVVCIVFLNSYFIPDQQILLLLQHLIDGSIQIARGEQIILLCCICTCIK